MTAFYGYCFANLNTNVIEYKKNITSTIEKNIIEILNSSSWKTLTANKLALDCDNNLCLHIVIDRNHAYVAATSSKYLSKRLHGSTKGNCFFSDIINYVNLYTNINTNWHSGTHSKWFDKLYNTYSEVSENKIDVIKANTEETKKILMNSIDIVIDRGNNVQNLKYKTDQLNENANKFKKESANIKRHMRCENWKITTTVIGILALILIIAVIVIVIAI